MGNFNLLLFQAQQGGHNEYIYTSIHNKTGKVKVTDVYAKLAINSDHAYSVRGSIGQYLLLWNEMS